MKKILIADDEEWAQSILSHAFLGMPDKVIVLQARTRQEAAKIFDSNPDIDLIALDACMPHPDALPAEKGKVNTLSLIRYFRDKDFTKPIVAVSSLESFNALLKKAGCDYSSSKQEFGELAIHLLDLM